MTTRPSATMPRPRPVEAFTTSASRSRRRPRGASSSARASTSASLPTKSGASRDAVEVRRELDAVPAGHHRRVQADPAHRCRRCRAGSARSPRTGGSTPASSARAAASATCGISSSGPTPTSWSRGVGGELGAVEVEDRELAAGAPDRDGQHDAGVLVEDQGARGPAAGRGELLADQQQPGGGQRLDPGDHGGAGQPGEPPQLRAGVGAAGADQLEQLAGGRRGRRLARSASRLARRWSRRCRVVLLVRPLARSSLRPL